jgi:hypothetical protein
VNVRKFKRFLLMFTVVLSANAICSAQFAAQGQTLASINSYATQIDRFIKRHPKRIFANEASEMENGPDRWREFKTAAEVEGGEATFDESAYVWQKSGKVVAANFTFTSQSGDWAQYVNYYFREDGTLARIQVHLNTFYGNLSVIREKFYDGRGRLLHTSTRYLNLHSRKPTKSRDFMDQPVPLYLKARDLPFYKLL